MMHHSHHVQIPPSTSHHHRVNVSVNNYRNQFLDCSRTKVGQKCTVFIISLGVVSAIIYFGVKFLSGPGDLGHTKSDAEGLPPYTSLVFPVSGLYCHSYSMKKYSGSSTVSWDTSLYILKNLPTLSTRYNFSIHPEDQHMITLMPGEFYQWSFILYGGSRYEINSCVSGKGNVAELLVIKGETLFNQWEAKRQYSGHMKHDLPPCNSTTATEQSLMCDISKEDEYYFVYLNPTRHVSHVQVDMSFTKLEYSLDQADIYCQCSYNKKEYPEYYTCSSCNLPLTFKGYVLLQTIPDSDHHGNIHWEDKIYITWSCDASYKAYLLLFCLPFMVIISIVLICSDILPLINSCKHQKSDSNAEADNEQSHSFQCSRGVVFVLLRLLIVLLILLGSVCAMVLILTTILTAISSISLNIPGLSNSKLKLGLLATSAGLFVATVICTKLKQCTQKKLDSLITVMRRRQSHQTSNIISSALQSDLRTRLQNLALKLLCVCCVGPLVIITILSMSAMLTFLEAFFPVLSIYGSDSDSWIFIPGDIQTFSFNNFFCSEYSISSYGSSHLSATLHVVNSDFVIGNHSVTYMSSNESISADLNATWNFYLNEKSGASIKTCLFEDDLNVSTTIDLYEYDSSGPTLLHAYNITDYSCYGDLWQIPIGNISGKPGKYLLLLFTHSIDPVQVHVEIELNRFLYFVPNNIVMSSTQTCSVSSHTSDTCIAVAPSSAGSMTGIISASSDQSPINWHETISITKTCHYHMATWTVLWLPVLLINVAIFSVVCGAIQRTQFKQIQKELNQEEATETDSEPLLHREANDNNYGTNTVTAATDVLDPTASDNQASEQRSDPEPVHEVVEVEIEHTSDHDATTGPSDPMGIVVQINHPPSTGDPSTGPTSESGATESAIKHEPVSSAKASIRSISDSKDASETIEHNTTDTTPIIDTEVEDTNDSYRP